MLLKIYTITKNNVYEGLHNENMLVFLTEIQVQIKILYTVW